MDVPRSWLVELSMAMRSRLGLGGFALAALLGLTHCSRSSGLVNRESVLRRQLETLREVLEQYESDHRKHPESLDALVAAGYLRILPYDPITRSNQTWVVERGEAAGDLDRGVLGVRSGADGVASDGTRYIEW
jgi:type II secretory pathway pseudopilin PulG